MTSERNEKLYVAYTQYRPKPICWYRPRIDLIDWLVRGVYTEQRKALSM